MYVDADVAGRVPTYIQQLLQQLAHILPLTRYDPRGLVALGLLSKQIVHDLAEVFDFVEEQAEDADEHCFVVGEVGIEVELKHTVEVDAAIRKRRCPHYGWTLEIVRLIYRLAQ